MRVRERLARWLDGERMMNGCPHKYIIYCPLYHEAHEGDGFGCDDGRLDQWTCAADRDLDYAAAIARLQAVKPRIVAELEFKESAEQSREQQRRNMRLAGVH